MPHKGYAPGKFGQVHYQDTLGDGIPIILCHQAPMTSRQFDMVYPIFKQRGVRAIGIDMPGFGMSDAPDDVPTIEDYTTIIPSVLDHLNIEIADVCGHHTGALLATEVAIQSPDRIRNVIINGPSPLNDEDRANWLEYTRVNEKEMVHETDGSHLAEFFKRRWQWAEEGTDPALVTRYVVETFMGYGPFWYGHNAAFCYDHEAKMKQLKHRTMILTNTGDIIHDLAKEAHKIRPDFEYVSMEGGMVDIVDQQPEQWVDAVLAFIGAGS